MAIPANTGITKTKIMIAAWVENSPLKTEGSTIWVPGCASSARMSIAISPPMKKKMKVVQMYWIPITL